jgi:hypothetical protein
MDPDELLVQLLKLSRSTMKASDKLNADMRTGWHESKECGDVLINGRLLAEGLQALDGWITSGGRLPSTWKPPT